jgi:hypothetical protein
MEKFNKYYEARNFITDIISRDLIGPVSEDEVLSENPESYYIMGKLYPLHNRCKKTECSDDRKYSEKNTEELEDSFGTEDISETEKDPEMEETVSLGNIIKPSAAGITFILDRKVGHFSCHVQWARYKEQSALNDQGDVDGKSDNNHPEIKWIRESFKKDISIFIPNDAKPIQLEEKFFLHIQVHSMKNRNIITATLVNRDTDNSAGQANPDQVLFQVGLRVEAVDNMSIFLPGMQGNPIESDDQELEEIQMLYSGYPSYAQGHGCSAVWDIEHPESGPKWIQMSFIPMYNVLQMCPPSTQLEEQVFQMQFLATGEQEEVIVKLNKFLDSYHMWIEKLEKKLVQIPNEYQKAAKKNIERCRSSLQRMKQSVKYLEHSARIPEDPVWISFQLANEVMLRQRNELSGHPDRVLWRPFQLAFILQEISDFISPKQDSRKSVDLLWFPTGGGKTEAYLGIAAFAIFLRRLRNREDESTAIMMRYTLRLLTIQQFERACKMIMACEMIRREHHLFKYPVTMGLWVGAGLTPNKIESVTKYLQAMQKNKGSKGIESGDPCVLKRCPWCHEVLTYENYYVDSEKNTLVIRCHNPECPVSHWKEGMPIYLVDEDIYKHYPTFLLGTIDKFAQLPKNEKAASLFGFRSDHRECPPELIIQDELHLVSGPLGSITGIYETAIDALCTTESGISPKIICSTATVRNARHQVKALFGRSDYSQFPSQGISADDSFFARKASESEAPARLYCGIMGTSATPTTTVIRTLSSLLFATRYLLKDGYPKEVVDQYWTLTGYFNSIRELGNAITQINDDVHNRFDYLCNNKFIQQYPCMKNCKFPDRVVELTSRNKSEQVAGILEELETPYGNSDEEPIDILVASNMISVGVDVDRLGIMFVVGQPKGNAEYIQATSRVGRKNPGLVLTMFNMNRSRDRSHYEQFFTYHSALYQYVESSSLTPFSDRTRDKALQAVFVILCRYLDPSLRSNSQVVNFGKNEEIIAKAKEIILNRIKIVDPDAYQGTAMDLDEIIREWKQKRGTTMVYYDTKNPDESLIQRDDSSERFSMMNSMRNVDGVSGVFIRVR